VPNSQLKSNESKYRGSGHACSLTEAMGADVRLATASALEGGISIGAEVDRESERTNQQNLRNSTRERGLSRTVWRIYYGGVSARKNGPMLSRRPLDD
jgi:hypothetical protein